MTYDQNELAVAANRFLEAWWEVDSLPPQETYNAVAHAVRHLDEAFRNEAAPVAAALEDIRGVLAAEYTVGELTVACEHACKVAFGEGWDK